MEVDLMIVLVNLHVVLVLECLLISIYMLCWKAHVEIMIIESC
ncbi:hypothetical protein HanRHA438_Chr03g0111481 [Helianthus annuus]|nr:hypothetical protein HanRHA438_Chr03g0111481 [Helianthus annuus]